MPFDIGDAIETIWDALEEWRDANPESSSEYNDERWGDICSAMANMQEAMGLPSAVEVEKAGGYQ